MCTLCRKINTNMRFLSAYFFLPSLECQLHENHAILSILLAAVSLVSRAVSAHSRCYTSITVEWVDIWLWSSESHSLIFVLLSYHVRFCLGFKVNLSHMVFHFPLFSNLYFWLVLLRPKAGFCALYDTLRDSSKIRWHLGSLKNHITLLAWNHAGTGLRFISKQGLSSVGNSLSPLSYFLGSARPLLLFCLHPSSSGSLSLLRVDAIFNALYGVPCNIPHSGGPLSCTFTVLGVICTTDGLNSPWILEV